MDPKSEALRTLAETHRFFHRTVRCLDESDSLFKAHPETMTVASHVAHAAQVVDWFSAGAFENVWNLDFPAQQAVTNAAGSFDAARAELDAAWRRLTERIERSTESELAAAMPDNPILGAVPRVHIVSSLVDHTAHHRGALAVYARLAGKSPGMPYGDD
jgi:uncharacterized damage-inducible protein DinB